MNNAICRLRSFLTGFCFFLVSALFSVSMLLTSCINIGSKAGSNDEAMNADLDEIKERGEIVVLTVNSSASYFSYRDEPMGFQYELAKQFAESIGVSLKMNVVNSEIELVRELLSGNGDLIAYNLAVTNKRKDSLIYCGEENISHQVLVQRKGRKAVKDVTQLVGKDVYVLPGRFKTRLKNLNQELGGGINICEVSPDSSSVEDLITLVAQGKIDYTIANNELAKINKTYNPNLDISVVVSFDQKSSWAVRKTSPKLAEAADKWHRENVNSAEFMASAKRYFELNKKITHGSVLSLKDGKISYYDDIFKKYSKEIDWDWRVLAALVYTESNFNPNVVSWAGAKGLMQLMPRTAHAYGVPKGMEADPEESVKAGVKYIAELQSAFSKIQDKDEKMIFVLAAYNSGIGHVFDAMALAEKYGKNKYKWDGNVATYLMLKSNEEYYRDPVCKNGYFRGTETFNFIHEVMSRADEYIKKIKK